MMNSKLSLNPEFSLRIEDNDMVELDNYFTVNSKTHVFGATYQNATLVLSTPHAAIVKH